MSLINVLLLFIFISGGFSKHLPSYIQVCKKDQATINVCLRQSLDVLKPRLADGLPELEVPGIDPFYIPELIIERGSLPYSDLRVVGRNVEVRGAGSFTIKSLDVDLDTLTIKTRIQFLKLEIKGQYTVDLRFIQTQAILKADIENCEAELVLKGKLKEINGTQYLEFTSLSTDMHIEEYRMQLEHLFRYNFFVNQANQILELHKDIVLYVGRPYLEKTMSEMFLDTTNKIVKDIPFDELLPANTM